MTQSTINRTELLFIQIFRWVVILVLTLLLLGSIWFGINGMLSLPGPHEVAEPPKPAAALVVSFDEWLAKNKPKNAAPPTSSAKSTVPGKEADDPAASKFIAQVGALWPIVAAYQKACNTPNPLTRLQFVDSLVQTPLPFVLFARPDDYATSQVVFAKQALENPETIRLCRSGKPGIFLSILEFHQQQYDSHVERSKYFEEAERERVLKFAAEQERERDRQSAEAQHIFSLSAYSFGFFLGLMLLLIFTRIEINLRAISAPR